MTTGVRVRVRKLLPSLPQQVKFLQWGANKDNVSCIMEMRLGKTLGIIRWLKRKRITIDGMNICLVLAPVSVLEAWEKELQLERESYAVLQGRTKAQREKLLATAMSVIGRRSWLLLTYDTLRTMPELTGLPWHFVGADESYLIANPQVDITKIVNGGLVTKYEWRTLRTGKRLRKIKSRIRYEGFNYVKHKATLTGLPAPESELNLFHQFKFIDGKFMGFDDYWAFRNKLFRVRFYKWVPKMGVAERIKKYVHERAFVMTRKEAGIPDMKVRAIRTVKMSPDQKRMYDEVEREFSTSVQRKGKRIVLETELAVTKAMWLRRFAGGCEADGRFNPKWNGKIKEILYLLKGELSREPVVIWFTHTSEIKAVEAALKKAKIQCRTLTGADSRADRKTKLNWFRTSKSKRRVILVQIKIAAMGLDMSVSSTAIYYSVSYSCNLMTQSEDRIIHPFKKDPLLLLYLVTEGTVDVDAVGKADDKMWNSKTFMDRFIDSFNKRQRVKFNKKTLSFKEAV